MRPPPPGEGKRGEQGYLAYLLRQAQASTRLAMERALADLGVTSPQFLVLTMLKAYPGLSGADVARVSLLTPQTVGVIIRNLERDGAIRKTPHPVHGRVLQWTLTRRGVDLLANAAFTPMRSSGGWHAGCRRRHRRRYGAGSGGLRPTFNSPALCSRVFPVPSEHGVRCKSSWVRPPCAGTIAP